MLGVLIYGGFVFAFDLAGLRAVLLDHLPRSRVLPGPPSSRTTQRRAFWRRDTGHLSLTMLV